MQFKDCNEKWFMSNTGTGDSRQKYMPAVDSSEKSTSAVAASIFT